MSLRFAILTALAERPATGLQLARRFDRSIGYFWSASHQQIYRELDRLHADGLVAGSATSSGRGQPRAHRITPKGRRALAVWVADSDAPTPLRESLMVRMRAAAALGEPQAVRAAIVEHLAAHEQYLATYETIEQRDFAAAGCADDATDLQPADLQHMVLRCGIELEQAWAQWCRTALNRLDSPTAPVVPPSSAPGPPA